MGLVRRNPVHAALVAALAIVGVTLVLIGVRAHSGPPPVHAAGRLPHVVSSQVKAPAAPTLSPKPQPPVSIRIPVIRVDAPLMQVGLTKHRALQVPPLSHAGVAGWYRNSVDPGDPGTSVIVGHVDSFSGPAVFYNVSVLKPGETIQVRRRDGRTAVFSVDKIASYRKDAFPSRLVYRATRYPSLRLITCGGPFDAAHGGYQDNTVVFASLTRMLPAKS